LSPQRLQDRDALRLLRHFGRLVDELAAGLTGQSNQFFLPLDRSPQAPRFLFKVIQEGIALLGCASPRWSLFHVTLAFPARGDSLQAGIAQAC
jgi:hypothetical protein